MFSPCTCLNLFVWTCTHWESTCIGVPFSSTHKHELSICTCSLNFSTWWNKLCWHFSKHMLCVNQQNPARKKTKSIDHMVPIEMGLKSCVFTLTAGKAVSIQVALARRNGPKLGPTAFDNATKLFPTGLGCLGHWPNHVAKCKPRSALRLTTRQTQTKQRLQNGNGASPLSSVRWKRYARHAQESCFVLFCSVFVLSLLQQRSLFLFLCLSVSLSRGPHSIIVAVHPPHIVCHRQETGLSLLTRTRSKTWRFPRRRHDQFLFVETR